MGIGPRIKGDIKTSIKKLAYPKPTHKPKGEKKNKATCKSTTLYTPPPPPPPPPPPAPPNLAKFWAFKRSPILIMY